MKDIKPLSISINAPFQLNGTALMLHGQIIADMEQSGERLCLRIKSGFEILTPLIKNHQARFDYQSLVSQKPDQYFNRIIIKTDLCYLQILADFSFSLSIHLAGEEITLTSAADDRTVLTLSAALSLKEFFSDVYHPVPLPVSGAGFLCDYQHPLSELKYCSLIDEIQGQPVFAVLHNWYQKISPLKGDSSGIGDEEGLFHILRINRIPYLLEYSFMDENKNTHKIIRYRDQRPFDYKESVFIDLFNPEGYEKAAGCIQELLGKNCAGISIQYPALPLENSQDIHRIVIKEKNRIENYKDRIKTTLFKQNELLTSGSSLFHLSRFAVPEQDHVLLLADPFDYSDFFFDSFLHLLYQYPSGFALYLSGARFGELDPRQVFHFLLGALACSAVIFDIQILLQSGGKKKKISRLLQDFVRQRTALRVFFENNHADPESVELVRKEGALQGVIYNQAVYCAMEAPHFLDQKVYLPQGEWYYPETDSMISGEKELIIRSKHGLFPWFIRKNSIIPVIDNDFQTDLLNPSRIRFYVWTEENAVFSQNETLYINGSHFTVNHQITLRISEQGLSFEYAASQTELSSRFIEVILIMKSTSRYKRPAKTPAGLRIFYQKHHIRLGFAPVPLEVTLPADENSFEVSGKFNQ